MIRIVFTEFYHLIYTLTYRMQEEIANSPPFDSSLDSLSRQTD